DSTNAQVPGVTPSELSVRPALRRALSETERRVVVVTFASNLARIRQTLELAHELGRRCCLVGWSMLRNFEAGVSLGFLRAQPGLLAQPRELPGIAPSRLCLLATGSQGEPLAALSRIAAGVHPFVHLDPGDLVVLAANPIPGNEAAVSAMINQLLARGLRVLAGSADGVHASGHAAREELRLMLELLEPQCFIPVHGEVRHLTAHLQLARECGVGPPSSAAVDNGQVVETRGERLEVTGQVQVGAVPILSPPPSPGPVRAPAPLPGTA
ncbi:MAG: MBL fold metallo-hydrolase RNA specificity domain-containing protein, partial [Candidatus Dormibacteria bacterium]